MKCVKGYSDGPFGQIHWRMWGERQTGGAPDLYCLHPAPYSGVAYQNLAPLLATKRRVIAPDYPGYGGSDPISGTPSIDDYAKSIAALIDHLSGGEGVDLVGFHTGCLVGAELCRSYSAKIRKACLIDVPAFPVDQSPGLAEKMGGQFLVSDDLNSLESAWNMSVVSRLKTQTPDQAWAMFAEHMRPGADMNAAFKAAFTYPWWDRFKEINSDVEVIASKSGLLDGSRRAAETIPTAALKEILEVERSVLDESAKTTASAVDAFLD